MPAIRKSKRRNAPSAGGAGGGRGTVYQQRVAAWWIIRILTQNTTIGAAFGLPTNVMPVRIAGHTEDAVDDLRVEFNDSSQFFLQCKRSVSISGSPASEFGKAWIQFCNQVKRAEAWTQTIRCILCYEEPNTVLGKLNDLFQRARLNPGWKKLANRAVSQKEKAAATTLERLHVKVRKTDKSLPPFEELVSLVQFQRLESGDACDARVQATEALQNGILSNLEDTGLAVKTLDDLGEELTKTRGHSFDIAAIRLRLRQQGVRLKDIPEYNPDLRELDAETLRTLESFRQLHRDQLGKRYTLRRPVVDEVETRVADGSLLIVGEPGAGKTGVLMALAPKLKTSGHRIWFLSVEGYKAESLPSLEKELNLVHRLTDILGIAAEGGLTVLMLDGLDAARDRVKQATWLSLVREAHRRGVRVIATIRLFDLRHSQPWQELFPLAPSEVETNAASGLSKVRIINVGELSENELAEGYAEFPEVQQLADSQPALNKLAKNIFNFSLLCQLAEGGIPHNPIHTQLELLEAWWNKRVAEAGNEQQIEAVLTKLVGRMVEARKLQSFISGLDTTPVENAQSAGLIRAIPPRPGYMPDDSVEFAHNVLFDYGAFRCFVLPKRDQLITELSIPESWGLFLRPSIGHFFTYLWEKYREEFWQRAIAMQSATVPVLHKTVVWFTIARSAQCRDDFAPMINGVAKTDGERETWLSLARGVNGCAEAAVWKQLFRHGAGLWWVSYACDLLRSGERVVTVLGWQILYALFYESEHFKPEAYPLINEAARLEVETHWPIAVPFGPGIKASIWLFCRTISGNPSESAKLIRKMLTPEELAVSGYFRGNQVADQIVPIARCVPDLAVEIYQRLYSFREMVTEKVPMGDSVVMAMQMSRHDMYGSCHHSLEKSLPEIFGFSAQTATSAVCRAICDPKDTIAKREGPTVQFRFIDHEIKTSDLPIYSEHLGQRYGEQSRLLEAWCGCLRGLNKSPNPREAWHQVAEALVQEASGPDMWAALFSVVPIQPDLFQDAVWPMLHSTDLLSCWRFRKFLDPCIESLAKIADEPVLKTWQDVVLSITREDLSRHDYRNSADALELLKASYLLLIPEGKLTATSRIFLAQCKTENARRIHPSSSRQFTPAEHVMMEQERNGLNPTIPLHRQLEKDLASFSAPGLKKVGPGILKRISEIEKRFLQADVELQSRLRAQFQNHFSWALRALAGKPSHLTERQFSELLQLCEGLLETSAGRENALEAIGLALSKKRTLSKDRRELLRRIAKRQEPEVVGHFGFYVWAFLKSWPEFVWDCLDRWISRMGEDEVAESLGRALHDSWFWWLFREDKRRALRLLQRMLDSGRISKRTELVSGFLAWFAAVAIDTGEASCQTLVKKVLSEPEAHATEVTDVVRVLVEWYMPRNVRKAPRTDQLQRAAVLTELFFNSAVKALQYLRQQQNALSQDQRPREPIPWVTSVAHQLDYFATEMQFSAESCAKDLENEPNADFKIAADAWWKRAEPLFAQFEKWLHPHLGSDLIHALGALFPHYPERCLHWLRKLCEAGSRTGLLFERLVVSDIIKILQRCLAERRDLLGSDKMFLDNFAAVLESLLNTANVEALGMAASLDEFHR